MASAVKGQRKGEMNTSHRSEDEGAPILLQEPCVGVTRSQEMCHKTVWSLQDGSDMETPITWLRCSKSKSPLSASMIPRSGLVQLGEEQPYTAARIGKLTLLTFGAILKWIVWCGDVKAAFLLGVTFYAWDPGSIAPGLRATFALQFTQSCAHEDAETCL